MSTRRRIAITGIGLVSPLGNDRETTWSNLRAGKSGVAQIQHFDASGFSTRIGAEVKNFDAETAVSNRKLRKFASRSHRFAFAAAEEAFVDAGIRPESATRERWGWSGGAGMVGFTVGD